MITIMITLREVFYPKFIWSYVAETFLASLTLTKTSKKNPLFEVISLPGPTGPLSYQFFWKGSTENLKATR